MFSMTATTAIPMALLLAFTPLQASEHTSDKEPWQQPGWEPVTEEERNPGLSQEEIAQARLPVQEANGIRYVSGGVGAAERAWLKQEGKDYSLKLQFSAGSHGAFVSQVEIVLRRDDGQPTFQTTSQGPLLYVDLPAGRYQGQARYDGQPRDLRVTVPESGQAQQSINFP